MGQDFLGIQWETHKNEVVFRSELAGLNIVHFDCIKAKIFDNDAITYHQFLGS